MPTLLQQIRENAPGTAAVAPEKLLRSYWEQVHAPKTPEAEAEGTHLPWEDFWNSDRVQESLYDEQLKLESPELSKFEELKRGVNRGIIKNTAGTFLELANFFARNKDWENIEELSADGLTALERLYDDPEWRQSYEAATGDWRNMNHFVSATGEGGTSIAAVAGSGILGGTTKALLKKAAVSQAKKKIRKATVKQALTKIGSTFVPGGRTSAMMAGGSLMGGEQAGDIRQFEAATGEDVPKDVEMSTVATNALVGSVLESLVPMMLVDKPMSAFMKRRLGKELSSKLTEGGFKAWAKQTGKATAGGMFGEFGTEYTQSILQNSLAQYGYDYDRDVLEGAFESGLVGMVTGGGMGAVSGTATHMIAPRDGLAQEMAKPEKSKKKAKAKESSIASKADAKYGVMDMPKGMEQPYGDPTISQAPTVVPPVLPPTVEDQQRILRSRDYQPTPTPEEISAPIEYTPMISPEEAAAQAKQEALQREVTGGRTLADIESGVETEFRGLYAKGAPPKLQAPPSDVDVNALLASKKGWASLQPEEKALFGDQRTFNTARQALKNLPLSREDIVKGRKAWGSLKPAEKQLFENSTDLYKSRVELSKLPQKKETDETEKVEAPVQTKAEKTKEEASEKLLESADAILAAFNSFQDLQGVKDKQERARLITMLAKDPRRVMNERQFAGAKADMNADYSPEFQLPTKNGYMIGTLDELKALPGGKVYTSGNPAAMRNPAAAHRLAKREKLKDYDVVIRKAEGKPDLYYVKERPAKKEKGTHAADVRPLGKQRSVKKYLTNLMAAVAEDPEKAMSVDVSGMINRIASEMELEANPLFDENIDEAGVDLKAEDVNKPEVADENRQKQMNLYEKATELFAELEVELELALANPNNSVDDIMNMLQGYVSQAVYEGRNYFQAAASMLDWTPTEQARYSNLSKLLKGNIELSEDEIMSLGILHAAAEFNDELDKRDVTKQIDAKIDRLERQKEQNVGKAIDHFNDNIGAIRQYHISNIRRIKNDISLLRNMPATGVPAYDIKGIKERVARLERDLERESVKLSKAGEPLSLVDIQDLKARNIVLDTQIAQLQKAKNMVLTNEQARALQKTAFSTAGIDTRVAGYKNVMKSLPPSALSARNEVRIGRLQTATGRLSGLLTGKFGEQIRNYVQARKAGAIKMKLPQIRGLQKILSDEGDVFSTSRRLEIIKREAKKSPAVRRPKFVKIPEGMPQAFPMEQLEARFWRWNDKFVEAASNEFFDSFKSYDSDNADHRADLNNYLEQAAELKAESMKAGKVSYDKRLATWLARNPENRKKFLTYQEKKNKARQQYREWNLQNMGKVQQVPDREVGDATLFDQSTGSATYDSTRVDAWSGLRGIVSNATALKFDSYKQAEQESARLRGSTEVKVNSIFDSVSGLINDKGSVKSVLDTLSGLNNLKDYAASDKLLKVLKGLNHVGNVPELEAIKVDWTSETRAYYEAGKIYMPRGSRNLYSLAHELMHGLTVEKIANNAPGVAELRRVYDLAKQASLTLKDPTVGVMYSFNQENDILGMQEFAAEVFINPELQAFLNGVKDPRAPKKSLWHRFVQAVANILGIKMDGTLLSSSMQATYDVMEGPAQDLAIPGRWYQSGEVAGEISPDPLRNDIAKLLAKNLDLTLSEAAEILEDPNQSVAAYTQLVQRLAIEEGKNSAGMELNEDMTALVDRVTQRAELKAMQKDERFRKVTHMAQGAYEKISFQKDFFDRNVFDRVAKRWHAWTLTTSNLIDVITNFNDSHAREFKELFIRRVSDSENDKIIRVEDRQKIFKSVEEKYDIDVAEMAESSQKVSPSTDEKPGRYKKTWDAMMVYAARNSPKFQQALVDNAEPDDHVTIESLQAEAKFLQKTLPKGYKVLADFMQADLAKQAQDIAEKLADLEAVYVIKNEGKPVPQAVKAKLAEIMEGYGYFEEQSEYIPIVGRQIEHTEDLLTDVAKALQVAPEGAKRTSLAPDLGHRGINTDLFSVWNQATRDQSHFLAYADVTHDMWTFLRGGNNRIDNLIERKFGKQMVAAFEAYVHSISKPTEHIAKDGVSYLATKVRGMAALSFLGWNLMTMAKQVPSFMYFAAKVPPGYLVRSLTMALSGKGSEILELVQQEPQMRGRQMEEVMTEIDNMDQAVYEKTLGRMLEAAGMDHKNAMLLKKKTFKSLMGGIRWADKWVTSMGYFAVYQHQKAMGLDETEARYQALQAVLTSQPASNVKDVPRLWRHHSLTSTLLMFTNQLTKIYNMGMHDILLRQMAGKNWTNEQTRTAVSLAMGALGIGVISHGFRWEDDDENTGRIAEGRNMLVGGAMSTLPLVGGPMAAAWNNWPATSDLVRTIPHSFVMTGKHMGRGEWEKMVKTGMRGALIPGQAEMLRIYEAGFDPNYSYGRIAGAKPVYKTPESLIPLMQEYKKLIARNKRNPEEGRRNAALLRKYKREADKAQRMGDVRTANRFKTKARKLRDSMPELKLKRRIFSTYPNKWGYKKSEVYKIYRSL